MIKKSKIKVQRRYKASGFSKSQKELEKLKIERIAKVTIQGLHFQNLYMRGNHGGGNSYSKFHNITTPVIEYFSKKKNISIQKPKFKFKKRLKTIFRDIREGKTEAKKKLLELVLMYFIQKTQGITLFLLAALHSKRDNLICKFLHLYLLALFRMSFITVLAYYDINSGKVRWICIGSGGAFGISTALALSIHIPLTVFVSRNIYQQFNEYFKYRDFIQRARELEVQNLEELLKERLRFNHKSCKPQPMDGISGPRLEILKINGKKTGLQAPSIQIPTMDPYLYIWSQTRPMEFLKEKKSQNLLMRYIQ